MKWVWNTCNLKGSKISFWPVPCCKLLYRNKCLYHLYNFLPTVIRKWNPLSYCWDYNSRFYDSPADGPKPNWPNRYIFYPSNSICLCCNFLMDPLHLPEEATFFLRILILSSYNSILFDDLSLCVFFQILCMRSKDINASDTHDTYLYKSI